MNVVLHPHTFFSTKYFAVNVYWNNIIDEIYSLLYFCVFPMPLDKISITRPFKIGVPSLLSNWYWDFFSGKLVAVEFKRDKTVPPFHHTSSRCDS
jgi:hypothetical protein